MGIKSHGNQIPWESNPLGIKNFGKRLIFKKINSHGNQIPWESNPMGIKSLGNQIPWELKILANG